MDADVATLLDELKRHLERRLEAEACARREGDAANAAGLAEVRALLASPEPDRIHDPVRWRRHLLRELWLRHYRLMSRSGAAIAIAGDWLAFEEARRNAPPEPGTREAVFDQLGTPMSAKTIQNDLAGR